MQNSKQPFIRGREVFERMNYLYQLSLFWANLDPELSAYYAKLVVAISKKAVLRLDSSIKRTICKGCSAILIEGKTVRSYYSKEHLGQVVRTCNICGVTKRYPCPKPKRKKNKKTGNK